MNLDHDLRSLTLDVSPANWNHIKKEDRSSIERWIQIDRWTEGTGSVQGCVRKGHWGFVCMCVCVISPYWMS